MKPIHITRAAIVGIFIFLGLAIFVAAVFTIGSQQKTFASSVTVKAVFEDVSGLQAGNNVWLSGVKIGTVKKISFVQNTAVEITMSIDEDAQPHIMKDAKAKIGSDGFIGNRIVIIYGGTPAAGSIAHGGYLKSEVPVSTDDMMAKLQKSNNNLLDITTDIKTISKNISDGKGTIGQLINDPSIADNLHDALVNFKTVSAGSEMTIAKINDIISSLNKQGTVVNELENDTVAFADFRKTISQLKDASTNISSFADNLNNAGKSLNKTDNAAGTILHNQQVASDLKSITRNLDESSKKLDEDLEALQHNFLLRGYFRKQEKKKNAIASDSLPQH